MCQHEFTAKKLTYIYSRGVEIVEIKKPNIINEYFSISRFVVVEINGEQNQPAKTIKSASMK